MTPDTREIWNQVLGIFLLGHNPPPPKKKTQICNLPDEYPKAQLVEMTEKWTSITSIYSSLPPDS